MTTQGIEAGTAETAGLGAKHESPVGGNADAPNTVAPILTEREAMVRAMYESWPFTVISPALAEATGLPLGETIPWEKAVATGADMSGLARYADAILSHRLTTEGGLREALEPFARALETGLTSEGRALDDQECCSGHDCGCHGSTFAQRYAYELRKLASSPPSSEAGLRLEPKGCPTPGACSCIPDFETGSLLDELDSLRASLLDNGLKLEAATVENAMKALGASSPPSSEAGECIMCCVNMLPHECTKRATPSAVLDENGRNAVLEEDVWALRYVLNFADSNSRVSTIMKPFTLPERLTIRHRLERLYAALKSPPLTGAE